MKRKLFSILLALAMMASLGLATVPVAAAPIGVTDVAPASAPAEIEPGEGAGVPATIDPVGEEFNIAIPADVVTTITWNDALSITSINDGTRDLVLNTDYTLSGDTLTILSAYLADKLTAAEQFLTINIFFDVGAATLMITAIDTTPVPATLYPTAENYDLFANDDVVTDITWNSATSVTSIVDNNSFPLVENVDYTVTLPVSAGEGQTGDAILTIVDSSYLWWNLDEPGESVVLTVTFDVGAAATFTITAVWGGTPASISTDTDLFYIDDPLDTAVTIVTYNDAGPITTINDGTDDLTIGEDYTLTGDTLAEEGVSPVTLTILNSYLAGKLLNEGDSVVLTINFTHGPSVTFTITATWDGISATIFPGNDDYNIFFPGNDDLENYVFTDVTFNEAGGLVSIYNGNDDLQEGVDYEILGVVTGGEGLGGDIRVHIFNDYLATQLTEEGDWIQLTFNFTYGCPAYFDVYAYATVRNITQHISYWTIQDAINDANSGDVIEVGNGDYEEYLEIYTDLTLQTTGYGRPAIISSYNPVINIGDYNVTIDGFEIVSDIETVVEEGCGGKVISIEWISNGNTVNIWNNYIAGSFYGIWANTVYGTLNIEDNYFEDIFYGIYLNWIGDTGCCASEGEPTPASYEADVNITDNCIDGAFYGIYAYYMNMGSLVINENELYGCFNGIYGEYTSNYGYPVNYEITDNYISFLPFYNGEGSEEMGFLTGIFLRYVQQTVSITGNTIEGFYQTGIKMVEVASYDGEAESDVTNIYIEENEITCRNGVQIGGCNPIAEFQDCNLYIRDNFFSGNNDFMPVVFAEGAESLEADAETLIEDIEETIGGFFTSGVSINRSIGNEDAVGYVEISGNLFTELAKGVYIWNTNNDSTVLIQNNGFFDTNAAIFSQMVTEGSFSVIDNIIENTFTGIGFSWMGWNPESLANINVTGNTITNAFCGISAGNFAYGTLNFANNTLTQCVFGILGNQTGFNCGQAAVSYNVTNNTIYYGNDDVDAVESIFMAGAAISLGFVEQTTSVTGNTITGPYNFGIKMPFIGCFGNDDAVAFVDGNNLTGCAYGFWSNCVAFTRDAELYLRNNTFTDVYDMAIEINSIGNGGVVAGGEGFIGEPTCGYAEISGNSMVLLSEPDKNAGIYIEYINNGAADIFNNTIEGYYNGIYVDYVGINVENVGMDVENVSIESYPAQLNIAHNDISNACEGVYVGYAYDGSVAINSNNLTDCYYGIWADESSYGGNDDSYQIMFNNVTNTMVCAGEGNGGYSTGIYFYAPENVTYIQGNVISGYYYGINLYMMGYHGDEVGSWYVDNNQVTDCNYGFYLEDLFCCIPGTFYFRYNTASDNVYGLYVYGMYYDVSAEDCELYLTNNSFVNNSEYGVYNENYYGGNDDLVAINNWWGDETGPYHDDTNLLGQGNAVSDYVIFEPWLGMTPPDPVNITTRTIPSGMVGVPYLVEINAAGGTEPYTWTLFYGALPHGLNLDQITGQITGTTVVGGIFTFDILVTDAEGISNIRSFSLEILLPYPGPTGGGGGGGGGGIVLSPSTGLTGSDIGMDNNGVAGNTGTFTSVDGNVTITVPAGTQLLDADGNPLTNMTTSPLTDPPAPPEGADILLAYLFGPPGATFNPPISITFEYDPATLPPGATEDGLTVAYWDGTQWLTVTGVVDPVNNTITIQVSHYSTYAILAQIPVTTTPAPTTTPPAPTTTGPAPTTTPPATTTTGPAPTTTPPATTTGPAPTTTSSVAPTTEAPAPAKTNWGLIIGIIGGVIVVALIIVLVMRSRKRE